ncbi:hypothetical protein J7376_19655 [Paracoccus sp. R12_1]|nr:hypothetical protein [Paracoccus sp. R12_2]MBO9488719.1 hypothetical protein [Paracoccus sp. R12_1]
MDQHGRRRQGAQMIALGLAMKSSLGEADAETLSLAVIAVKETLPKDDPLYVGLDDFADLFPRSRRDPTLLKTAGQRLWRAVERSTWPMPAERADVEG